LPPVAVHPPDSSRPPPARASAARTLRNRIAIVWPRRVALFDKLNANAGFVQARARFAGLPVAADRAALHALVSTQLGPGALDYLEFGVWWGQSLKLWTTLNTHPDSRLFGFDTFEGLPEDWGSVSRGTFSTRKQLPSLGDARVRLIPGLFQHTLYAFLAAYRRRDRLVVHIDCDLYSATLFCLAALDRCLRPGDVLIFDDFFSLDHEFDAFLDYRRAFYRVLEPLASSPRCVQAAFRVGERRDGPD
jgi:O-methyltransferase